MNTDKMKLCDKYLRFIDNLVAELDFNGTNILNTGTIGFEKLNKICQFLNLQNEMNLITNCVYSKNKKPIYDCLETINSALVVKWFMLKKEIIIKEDKL